MKRIWLGLGLLGLLLGLGLLTARSMDRVNGTIARDLEQAAQSESWKEAAALSQGAAEAWQRHSHFTASLADHKDIDQIDGLFAQLEVLRRREDHASHATLCAYLSESVTALMEAHRLTWWNLL